MRCLFPCVVPLRYVALYALQSGGYIPSPEWIRLYSKMCHDEGQALWDVLHRPKAMLIEESDRIFFQRNPGTRNRVRYYVAGPLSTLPKDDDRRGAAFLTPGPPAASVLTPDGLPCDRAPLAEEAESSSSRGEVSVGQSLINALRAEPGNRGNPGRIRCPLDKDFEPLLPADTPSFSIDREGDDPDLHECPDTLEEMLFLVRKERQHRLDIIEPDHYTSRQPSRNSGPSLHAAVRGAGKEATAHPSLDDYI
jgi:hypothetical protein